MKNEKWKLFLFYVIGLLVMVLTTRVIPPLYALIPNRNDNTWWIGIGVGALFSILAVIFHNLGNGRFWGYWLSYFWNAVGSGCIIGTLYAEMGWAVDVRTLALGLVPGAVLGGILCLGDLFRSAIVRKIWDIAVLILNVTLVIAAIVVWVKWNHMVGSFAFFGGICQLFFQMAFLFSHDKPEERWRFLSFSGFWAFAVIAVIVVIILSEGDILDGLDFDIGGSGSAKKKKPVK